MHKSLIKQQRHCGSFITVYKDKSLMNKIYLRRQLYNLKMNDEIVIHEHLKEFNTLLNDLLENRCEN